RGGTRRLVGERLRAAPRQGVRRRHARRPPRIPALRGGWQPRLGTPPDSREAALPHQPIAETRCVWVTYSSSATPTRAGEVSSWDSEADRWNTQLLQGEQAVPERRQPVEAAAELRERGPRPPPV